MISRKDDRPSASLDPQTELVTSGRDTVAQKGFINPPVVRGSTVLYPTADDLHAHRGEFQYGRHGTPTTKALQQALIALEGPNCAGVGLAPSGVAAISTALLGVQCWSFFSAWVFGRETYGNRRRRQSLK